MNHRITVLLICLCVTAGAQAQDVQGQSTGTCIMPIDRGGDGKPHPCSDFSVPSTSGHSATNATAAMQGAAVQAGVNLFYGVLGDLLFGNKKNDVAAAAAAAEAARQQQLQEELARQRALEEKKRQEMFERLSQSLKLSGIATLAMKGFDNNPGLQLKGLGDSPTNAGGELHLKGIGDSPASNDDGLKPKGTAFFGLGGSANAGQGPQVPTGDPNVVDLRDLQQGVDLAVVAATAPADDQQLLLDQALNAVNGDKAIQVAMAPSAPVPVVSQDGLLAFQQANAEYRKARDTRYQNLQLFQQAQKKREMADALVRAAEGQLAIDLQNNIDSMTLAQKHAAMAKVYDAALQEHLAFGKTEAEYTAAQVRFDWARHVAEDQLMMLAKTGKVDPAKVQPVPKSDLQLLLPDNAPAQPSKADLELVADGIVPKPPMLSPQVARNLPPAVAEMYKTDAAFQQQMNQVHAGIVANLNSDYDKASNRALEGWKHKVDDMISRGEMKGDVPLGVLEAANPQLHQRLQTLRDQFDAQYEYERKLAEWRAESDWSNWVQGQNATLTGKSAPQFRSAP